VARVGADRAPAAGEEGGRVGRAVRRSLVAALAGCLLSACSGGGSSPQEAADTASRSAGSPTASPTATPSPPSRPERAAPVVPRVPARGSAALARQIDGASATLRHPAGPDDVRRAAEFQQLAIRDLAERGTAFRDAVTSRLRPGVARSVRGDVRAARLLRALGDPRPGLPRWRIVAPPRPATLLAYYRRAQRLTGVPWTHLAAIHLVETRMGRIRGTSTAGARGPMQFLPSTWAIYGAGGDIGDPRDAILAAARLLRRNGAPGDMAAALWHYNPSDNYVGAVLEYARAMRRSPAAYEAYWHWRVLYRHTGGTHVLPVGYPVRRAVRLPGQ
jgi:membrane-bound lytic murein transglycosylase B